ACPHHELECRIVALAGIEGSRQQHLALPARRFDPASKQQRMAKHYQPVARPEIEMSDPQLSVHHCNQALDLGGTTLGNLQFERAGKMQRLDVVHPGEGDLIVSPLPSHHDSEFVFGCTLEQPLVRGRDVLDHFERICTTHFGDIDNTHDSHRYATQGDTWSGRALPHSIRVATNELIDDHHLGQAPRTPATIAMDGVAQPGHPTLARPKFRDVTDRYAR